MPKAKKAHTCVNDLRITQQLLLDNFSGHFLSKLVYYIALFNDYHNDNEEEETFHKFCFCAGVVISQLRPSQCTCNPKIGGLTDKVRWSIDHLIELTQIDMNDRCRILVTNAESTRDHFRQNYVFFRFGFKVIAHAFLSGRSRRRGAHSSIHRVTRHTLFEPQCFDLILEMVY